MTEARFDANRDGNISRTERPREDESVRDLLDAADSDRDGVVAEQELIDELRLRAARTASSKTPSARLLARARTNLQASPGQARVPERAADFRREISIPAERHHSYVECIHLALGGMKRSAQTDDSVKPSRSAPAVMRL